MPASITFFVDPYHSEKPTMIVLEDGSVVERVPFLKRQHVTVALEPRNPGPSRAQLDAVEMISIYAIAHNPGCTLTYKTGTSPWALDMYAKNVYLAQHEGPDLPWPKGIDRPLRKRGRDGKLFIPKPVKKPVQHMQIIDSYE